MLNDYSTYEDEIGANFHRIGCKYKVTFLFLLESKAVPSPIHSPTPNENGWIGKRPIRVNDMIVLPKCASYNIVYFIGTISVWCTIFAFGARFSRLAHEFRVQRTIFAFSARFSRLLHEFRVQRTISAVSARFS